jgi:hypothetical protein
MAFKAREPRPKAQADNARTRAFSECGKLLQNFQKKKIDGCLTNPQSPRVGALVSPKTPRITELKTICKSTSTAP